MPYNTDGGSHRDGVSNEKKIVDHLNADNGRSLNLHELFKVEGLQFIQIGGTKSVSDMDVLSAEGVKLSGVSIKNHKQGSYDYVNTSKLRDYLPEEVVTTIKTSISAIKAEFTGDETRLPEARRAVESVLEAAFDQMSSEVLRKILQVISFRNPKLIMINDIKHKKLKCYHEAAFWEIGSEPYKASNIYALKCARGAKSSRQITRNGKVTNLRLRIVLNNGVKALLGLSSANRSSIPVIKIQQDKVDAVLANTMMYSQCDFGVETAVEPSQEVETAVEISQEVEATLQTSQEEKTTVDECLHINDAQLAAALQESLTLHSL